MQKFQFLQKLEIILNSFLISLVASFVRLIFYKTGNWLQTCLVFFGGVVFGTLVGYLLDGVTSLQPFSKILIAAAAIAGKEIIEFIIKSMPKLLKKFINKKIGDDGSNDNNTPSK